MFIDTHCHFDFPPFIDNIASSLTQLKSASIQALIVPSVASSHFKTVLSLAQQYPAIYAALGLHPIYQHDEQSLTELSNGLLQSPEKLVAIGEIGLDKIVNTLSWQQQCFFFESQLQLAKQHDLPVILHSRKTHEELYKLLKKHDLPCRGVIHGFSGSYQQALQFVKLGYYIGVGGVITYARANKTREAIAKLPLNSLLLETDAPDMPPFGLQGQPNRPENIQLIYNALCELRNESPETIKTSIYTNTLRLFKQKFCF